MANNNNAIFNGAYSGIVGGSENARWLTSTNSSIYNSLKAAATALASQIDLLIPTDVAIGNPQGRLMQSICQSIFATRIVAGPDANIAAAIVALYNNVKTALAVESGSGYTPASGAPLRVATQAVDFSGQINILSDTRVALPVSVTLPNPDSTKLYQLEGDFDVLYYGGSLATAQTLSQDINMSLNGGGPIVLLTNSYYGLENATDFAWLHIHFATNMILGSDLGLAPLASSLEFDISANVPTGVLGQAFAVSASDQPVRGAPCVLKLTEYQP